MDSKTILAILIVITLGVALLVLLMKRRTKDDA